MNKTEIQIFIKSKFLLYKTGLFDIFFQKIQNIYNKIAILIYYFKKKRVIHLVVLLILLFYY